MDEKNNGLITIAAEGTVTISIEEYDQLVKRSFALDVILEHHGDSSYRLEDTIRYIKRALRPYSDIKESEDAEDA